MKKYKAIFFDWDGTAVKSRKASVEEAVAAMAPLLDKGVKLAIVSGTTIDNIASGKIEVYFTKGQLDNLYLGLGRGAYNYAFKEGQPYIFKDGIPDTKTLLDIHKLCFEIHLLLKEKYNFDTDIVFTRPNYCKIDLMVYNNRGDNLFMQEDELNQLKASLVAHGITAGLQGLLDIAHGIAAKYGLCVAPTCDAKYLEVGLTSKSDNADEIFKLLHEKDQIEAADCSFWGDEFVGIEEGIFGSDSFMRTELTKTGDFFDVSNVPGARPDGVKNLGGSIRTFLDFLKQQI